MKVLVKVCIALMVGVFISGCTKDSTSTSPSTSVSSTSALAGNWVVLSGLPQTKYLSIHGDNVYFNLHEFAYGLRAMDGGVAQVSGGTIDLGQSIYNYTVSGDTLQLTAPGQSVVCVRSTTAPSDSQWVSAVKVLDTMSTPIPDATDMTIMGNIMWYGNGYSSHNLYRINLSTRDVDTLPTTVYAWAVEWDGSNLWASSDGSTTIQKIDTATGATKFTSVQMGAWIYGIAWDGTVLWCTSNNEQSIYRYDPVGDMVLTTYRLGSGAYAGGVAYANGSLYVCTNGVINKCTTSPFGTAAAFQIPGIYAFGLAFDGTDFWVSGYDSQNKYMMYKVALP